jgi:hypothetical protein
MNRHSKSCSCRALLRDVFFLSFEFFKLIFPSQKTPIASLNQKVSVCISPFRGMHPPSIFLQLPHIHNHGVPIFNPFEKKVEVCSLLKYLQKSLSSSSNKEIVLDGTSSATPTIKPN